MLFILLFGISQFGYAQDYIDVNVNQPDPLEVDAGADETIEEGESIELGASPAAEGGNGGYLYDWSPTTALDDSEASNPTASPSETTTYTLSVTDEHECSASDEVEITVESATAINGGDENSAFFNIYPNPAKNSVFVSLENYNSNDVTITIMNASGKVIHQKEHETANKIKIPFDFSQVNPGIYFIRVNNDTLSNTRKIVIE
ncbi:MAG: T9SS type A sorting domain-containing protein [Bacteroidales bacterium]